jgi:TetR/AcrR family transcriptional regulator, transcriptional repressor for nem operon
MAPRRADPALRSGLVNAATGLFLSKGFAGTGIEEICATAGVTKGALFHHWPTKADLAAEVLEEWVRAGFQAYSAAPFLKSGTAVARVLGYVDFTVELSKRAPLGCLIGTFAQEVSESHPELRTRCARIFRDWSGGLAAMLEEAKREAGRPAAYDSRSLADHFVAIFEGAQLLAKARQSRAVIEEHLVHFRAYLSCLLGVAGRRGGQRRGRAQAIPRGRQRRLA